MPLSLTVSTIDLAFTENDAQRNTPTSPFSTPPETDTIWQVVACDIHGTPYDSLEDAKVISITQRLNAPDEAVVQVPIDSTGLLAVSPTASPQREVQVYRNGDLFIWGKVVSRRADATNRTMELTIKDPLWYLTRRYVGNANRDNRLIDGGFEYGTSPWLTNGAVTYTDETDIVLVGTQAAKLVCASSGDNYLYQRRTATSGAIGLNLFLTAWFYIETWNGAAGFDAGIQLTREGATGDFAQQVATITEDTPRQSWQRLSVLVRMPPNVTEVIRTELFAIDGTIRWDAVTLVTEQSLGFPVGTDQADIISTVVQYAQGRGTYAIYSPEKSDLNIATHCPTTGVQYERDYMLADHQKILDGGSGSGVIDEFLKSDTGVDIYIDKTPTSRTLKTVYPRRGTDRTGFVLTWHYYQNAPHLNSSWGIVGWRYADSLENTANQVCELGGWGGGLDQFATREEGGYDNPSTLGGLTLELVETAPQGAPIGVLGNIAGARGAQLEEPISTPELILEEPRDPGTGEVSHPLIGVLMPGDTVTVDLIDGTVVLDGTWRIAQIVYDCAKEQLTITPNPVA